VHRSGAKPGSNPVAIPYRTQRAAIVLDEVSKYILKDIVGICSGIGVSDGGQLSHDSPEDKRAESAKEFAPCRLLATDALLDERIGGKILPLSTGITVIVQWQRLPSREGIGSDRESG